MVKHTKHLIEAGMWTATHPHLNSPTDSLLHQKEFMVIVWATRKAPSKHVHCLKGRNRFPSDFPNCFCKNPTWKSVSQMESFLRKLHVCQNGVKLESSMQFPLHQIFDSGGFLSPAVNKIKLFPLHVHEYNQTAPAFLSPVHVSTTHIYHPLPPPHPIKNKMELNLPPIQGCFSFQRSHMSDGIADSSWVLSGHL